MTINTSPLHNGSGNIFNDQINSNSIAISWTASSTLLFSYKIDEVNELRETNELTAGQNYDLKIRFDGSNQSATIPYEHFRLKLLFKKQPRLYIFREWSR